MYLKYIENIIKNLICKSDIFIFFYLFILKILKSKSNIHKFINNRYVK